MKKVLLLVAVLMLSLSAAKPQCRQGCTTTFIIVRCDGSPAEGVQIKLELKCQSESITKRTGSDGEAQFPYCKSDVDAGHVTITGVPSSSNIEISGGESNSIIRVKLCS
jgi:hypothetical protein